ncbi:MAG: single-stranded-DNA-specific exonuclease RecJ [Planctomycetes bacterium]|nr:single-stranded-DNA-specific exonuclease RecJ [Planctomycetota bacterium]
MTAQAHEAAASVAPTWVFPDPAPEVAEPLARRLGLHPLVAAVLAARGVDSEAAAERFLSPHLTHLHDPALLLGVPQAAERLCRAIRSRERIVIYGDYDVDGAAATAMLLSFFRLLDADVDHYIPSRLEEGYGIGPRGIEAMSARAARVVITVDNGMSSVDEIDELTRRGMEVIVTDHHVPGPAIPRALAVINPKQPGCPYPFKMLAGVGVAFKLAWATARALAGGDRVSAPMREFLVNALASVALGTVADVAPLVDENRVFVHYGLRMLDSAASPGLRALLAVSESRSASGRPGAPGGGRLTATDLSFRLGPRLNAAGRLGAADLTVRLLTAGSEEEARDLAARVEGENRRRKEIERAIEEEARARVEREVDLSRDRVIVLASQGWHPGVIGIVCARLLDRFHRPAVLIALDGAVGRGSARSSPETPVFAAMEQCRELFDSFGGHAAAAGFVIQASRVPALREALNQALTDAAAGDETAFRPTLAVDARARLADLTPDLLRGLERLAPFGVGNPEPILAAEGLELAGRPRLVGRSFNHLIFTARQGDVSLRAVAFNQGGRMNELLKAERFSLAFRPRPDTWTGGEAIELHVEDLRQSGQPPITA